MPKIHQSGKQVRVTRAGYEKLLGVHHPVKGAKQSPGAHEKLVGRELKYLQSLRSKESLFT